MRWIVTDDIYAETWRLLLEFSNRELALDEIARRRGEPTSKSEQSNRAKQASQARVCVLQAKEYFDAARKASLFTRPNHAYYGAVALASLVMLILGDGTHSLDYLRSDKRNKHHGLLMTTACGAKSVSSGVALLETTSAEILSSGHFANLYGVLPTEGPTYALQHEQVDRAKRTSYRRVGSYQVTPFDDLRGMRRTLLGLLKYLPDLDAELQRGGISVIRSRSTHEIEISGHGKVAHKWILHGCETDANREALLGEFATTPRLSPLLSCVQPEAGCAAIVQLVYEQSDTDVRFTWPSSRETMNHDTISYATSPGAHELTDLYLVAFQLSMLARYYPDIWVSCIESQGRCSKLIERSVDLIIKKLPILALSLLGPEEVVISTHREHWKI